MESETWNRIEASFVRWPEAKALPVDPKEFDDTFAMFDSVDPDYREFVLRYGGAIVGAISIFGLRKPEFMGTVGRCWTAPDLTRRYREEKWPGVDAWLIFSVDQGGNPIGFAEDGTVWLSDKLDFNEIVQVASNFEDYLLKWCLKVRPIN